MVDTSAGSAASRIREALVAIVREKGDGALGDSRRLRAMLVDRVPGAEAEANVIGLAVATDITRKLREAVAAPATAAATIEECIKHLEQTSAVQSADARWAVTSIAKALGLPVASAAPSPPPHQPGAPVSLGPASAATGVAPGTPGPDDLRIEVNGQVRSVRVGETGTVGRDPSCTIAIDSSVVSRRHGRFHHTGAGWEYVDEGSTQGSFVGGARVDTYRLTGPVTIVLGQGDKAVGIDVHVPGRPPAPGHRPQAAVTSVTGDRPKAAATQLTNSADQLTAELAGQTRSIAPGAKLTIGREDDNDLVAEAASVSRHHAVIEHVDGGWRLVDLDSTAGTWQGKDRVRRVSLAGTQKFRLGESGAGDVLTIKAPGKAAKSGARSGNSASGGLSKKALASLGAAVVALGLVAALLIWRPWDGEPKPAAGPTSGDKVSPDALARATVQLMIGDWMGSGIIIDKKQGLILTNAHVAAPRASGLAITHHEFPFMQPKDPEGPEILVNVSPGLDRSAEPKFQAELVTADGYLDAAVIKIVSLVSGTPISPEDLTDLTQATIGDSDSVKTSDDVALVGYPGMADSEAPTYTTGKIAGPVPDARLNTAKAAFNTTAESGHGNSGGMAVNAAGEVIGLNAWGREDGASSLSSFRPINLVKPVIEAAVSGADYSSPWTTPGPEGATISGMRDAYAGRPGTIDDRCGPEGSTTTKAAAVEFDYQGFPGGDHVDAYAALFPADDEAAGPAAESISRFKTPMKSSGCLTITFDTAVAPGDYYFVVGVGGDLRVVYDELVTFGEGS